MAMYQVILFIITWFVFMFGALYTYDWIGKLMILIGSGYLAKEIIWWITKAKAKEGD